MNSHCWYRGPLSVCQWSGPAPESAQQRRNSSHMASIEGPWLLCWGRFCAGRCPSLSAEVVQSIQRPEDLSESFPSRQFPVIAITAASAILSNYGRDGMVAFVKKTADSDVCGDIQGFIGVLALQRTRETVPDLRTGIAAQDRGEERVSKYTVAPFLDACDAHGSSHRPRL